MNDTSIDNILSLINNTPDVVLKEIAGRVKTRRLEKDFTQEIMARHAGIALATYRRFERTGEISLRGLVMLAFALNMTDEFSQLFATKTYRNMDELLHAKQKKRKRASTNE